EWYGKRQMVDDQARALTLLAEGLLSQGRPGMAREPAERARALGERSEDAEVQVVVNAGVSRVDAAAGGASGARAAAGTLRQAVEQATRTGLVTAGLEARFVLGTIEIEAADRQGGREVLEAVRREAAERGFKLLAQRAEIVLKGEALGARLG
ncbi:MAG TPA: hypothetical protein VMM92_07625, partial [Thermoanaerobaculia bacterium]|nr:hypothetical protein [Thermoanaerobaculia bacterium]